MTERKEVATTLKNILDKPMMKNILNRETDPVKLVDTVKKWWTFDLYSRKPGPAVVDGVHKGTDLDLACFLMALADRGAVINIPQYKSMRPSSFKEGERITSKENRHGPIINLTANKDVFTFSIKIKDANVIGNNEVGAYRNFSITDPSGEWYKGWKTIQWDPSIKENAFLSDKKLWSGHSVVFSNFIHPNRWTSFYGQYYFMTKALIARLTDQAADYNIQIKMLLEDGIKYPEKGKDAKKQYGSLSKDKGKSVKFKSLEVEVDVPDYVNEYPIYESTQKNLIELTDIRTKLVYNIIPYLRFATRCTELAFFKYANKVEPNSKQIASNERMPTWLGGGVKWERNYKLKGKKILWDRLVIMQPGVGERAVSIRKRVKEKSEIMAMSYKE